MSESQYDDPTTSKNASQLEDNHLNCCEYIRQKYPELKNQLKKDFTKLTPESMAMLEIYRTKKAENCALDKQSISQLLQENKAYGGIMDHIQPESWQTGLEDCMHFYTNRWKEWVCYRLGHDDHDRNSIREYNTRFTLPMELKELQGLGPMDYCLRYCFLSTKRTGLYQRIFSKMKDNRHRKVNLKVVMDSNGNLLGGTLTKEQADELASLFELSADCKPLTLNEFYILCAVAERLYYQKNL
ncbi:unnamed protein product [Trichobilharzia szidati]|nr:unnamed protein product [Trichobilharzia szidati]